MLKFLPMPEIIGNFNEETYKGEPLRIFDGTYRVNDFSVPVHLAIHPNLSRRIAVNVPGYNGVIDGYAEKYKTLAHYMQTRQLAAVVRTGNYLGGTYPADINLNATLQYVEERAWEICGEPNPQTLLMGFSAGASAIAACAHEHPQVTTILLFAPSEDMPMDRLKSGLEKFKGDVYIVVGEEDEVVGSQAGKTFYDMASGAQNKELFLIPECDHQFRGEKNGRIISEAPFYAFAKDDKPRFPDPNGGIKLYD